jgi:hypothetical protein
LKSEVGEAIERVKVIEGTSLPRLDHLDILDYLVHLST